MSCIYESIEMGDSIVIYYINAKKREKMQKRKKKKEKKDQPNN